jgi:S-adenosylmethionine-diacylglycerol 3-amino-3-carboxypropyl transferase
MSKDVFFNTLNYSMTNEDSSFEWSICQALRPRRILAICGSGARVLPLAGTAPEKITALDLAEQQLALGELRSAIMKREPLEIYKKFFGYPPYTTGQHRAERAALFADLKLNEATRGYFQDHFRKNGWQGLLYDGRWEKTFTGISKKVRLFVGSRYDEIFDFTNFAEQKAYFDEKLQDRAWKFAPGATLMVVGNATFFNAVLYGGRFPRKNLPGSHFRFYVNRFRRLLYNGLTRENFFLQLVFLGELRHPEGCPIEVKPEIYKASQAALQSGTEIEFVAKDLLTFSEDTQEKYDFVSLSNVPSYFSGDMERTFMSRLKACLNPGAVVVVRCYLRIPEGTDLSGYEDITSTYQESALAEKMGVYNIMVYRFVG